MSDFYTYIIQFEKNGKPFIKIGKSLVYKFNSRVQAELRSYECGKCQVKRLFKSKGNQEATMLEDALRLTYGLLGYEYVPNDRFYTTFIEDEIESDIVRKVMEYFSYETIDPGIQEIEIEEIYKKPAVNPNLTKTGKRAIVGSHVWWVYKGETIHGTVRARLDDNRVEIMCENGKISKRQIKGLFS